MLHSCDAGEYSILTAYAPAYFLTDVKDGYSDIVLGEPETTVTYVSDIR